MFSRTLSRRIVYTNGFFRLRNMSSGLLRKQKQTCLKLLRPKLDSTFPIMSISYKTQLIFCMNRNQAYGGEKHSSVAVGYIEKDFSAKN